MAAIAEITFPDSFVEALAARVVAAIEARLASRQEWLSIEEAADHVCTTAAALRKAAQRGQVPAHQPLGPGTRYLFNRTELDDWAAAG